MSEIEDYALKWSITVYGTGKAMAICVTKPDTGDTSGLPTNTCVAYSRCSRCYLLFFSTNIIIKTINTFNDNLTD